MTATTQTLAAWLLEQIAADEARNADYHDLRAWHENGCGIHPQGVEQTWCDCAAPARILAACEAHRRIVEAHPRSVALDYCETCFSGDFGRLDDPLHEDWPCPTLRALAAIYADRDGYREEWR